MKLRKPQLPLFFAFAAACAALIFPAPGYSNENVVSTVRALSMCVNLNQRAIRGDIEPGRLTYAKTGKISAGNQRQFDLFLERVFETLARANTVSEKNLFLTFNVSFRFNKGMYKQIAAAGICRKSFGSKENECRNRTYFSFSYYEPEVLADAILADILKYEPMIAKCF